MSTSTNNPNVPPPPDPLAVALSKLDPAPHGFEWNALMFAAGRASKARALMLWRVVAGVCAVAAGVFAFAYFTRSPAVFERVVYVERPKSLDASATPVPATEPVPAPLPTPEPPAPSAEWSFDSPPEQGAATRWWQTRNEVLTVGLSVLPDGGRKVSAPRSER